MTVYCIYYFNIAVMLSSSSSTSSQGYQEAQGPGTEIAQTIAWVDDNGESKKEPQNPKASTLTLPLLFSNRGKNSHLSNKNV